jgi:uncharacterized lipoprotein YbaY/heat shock protein HslJ
MTVLDAMRLARSLAVVGALWLLALASAMADELPVVSGTATYRERIALPPSAVLEATLEEVSRADAPAEVIGRYAAGPAGQVPIPFAIPYDPARILPGRRYVVRARILVDDRPLFATTAAQLVLAPGAPDRPALVLQRVGGAAAPLAMRGMYRYMADAGQFTDCATRRRMPVLQAGDNAALERGYLAARRQPGEEILVEIEGRIEERPKIDGPGTAPTVLVDRFRGVWPRESCGAHGATSPLRNTYWKLVRLGEQPVVVAERQREPHLVFQLAGSRFSGAGGCNRLSGSFKLDGAAITLGQVVRTMMACVAGMDTEQAFLAALDRVRRWTIEGEHLELQDEAGRTVARLEAVALR